MTSELDTFTGSKNISLRPASRGKLRFFEENSALYELSNHYGKMSALSNGDDNNKLARSSIHSEISSGDYEKLLDDWARQDAKLFEKSLNSIFNRMFVMRTIWEKWLSFACFDTYYYLINSDLQDVPNEADRPKLIRRLCVGTLRIWSPLHRPFERGDRLRYCVKLLLAIMMIIAFIESSWLIFLQIMSDISWRKYSPQGTNYIHYSLSFSDTNPELYCKNVIRSNWNQEKLNYILWYYKQSELFSTLCPTDATILIPRCSAIGCWIPYMQFLVQPRGKEFHVEVVKFMLDPIGERRRVRRQLHELICSIIGDLMQDSNRRLITSAYSEFCYKLGQSRNDNKFNQWSPTSLGDQEQNVQLNSWSDSKAGPAMGQIGASIAILKQISLNDLVKPISFEHSWHKSIYKIWFFNSMSMIYVCCISIIIVDWFDLSDILYYELKLETQYNMCSSFAMNESRLISDEEQVIIKLRDQFRYNMKEKIEYNVTKFTDVLTFIPNYPNALSYFTTQEKFLILQYIMALSVGIFYFMAHYIIFLISILDKMKWLSQLDKQLESCCKSLEETVESGNIYRDKIDSINSIEDANENGDIQTRITRELIVCFLNYHFFKCEHKKFRPYSDYVTNGIMIVLTFIMVAANHAGNYGQPELYTYVVFSNFFIIFACNVMWFFVAYMFSYVIRVRKRIAHLVALGRRSRYEFQVPLTLWNRHELDEWELKSFYACRNYLGIIDFRQVLKLNCYLMAFWIILFK